MMFSRTEQLLGSDINKLFNSSVIVFGVGGVGGYAVEMLVRSGIHNITIVDYDKVDITNKNRQIIALDSTIGRNKVDVLKDRIFDINPKCVVKSITDKLTPENVENFNLNDYDYIVDCIDMVSSKIALIDYAHKNNIKIISAMGAGNRRGIPEIVVDDIYNTFNDGLSKVIRHKLRELGIKKHKVVFSKNIAVTTGETIGSISYYPAICGCMLASQVIEDLIKN